MPDDFDQMPASRLVRWGALALLIAFAIAFYFRDGLRLAPLDAGTPPPSAQSE